MLKFAPRSKKPLFRRLRHGIGKLWFNVVSLNDTPHAIALGVALGTFVAYLPIVGIQMVLSAAVAWMIRANVAASLAPAWITNPVSIVPIFFGLYILGGIFTGDAMSYGEMASLVKQINEAGITSFDGISQTIDLMGQVWWPMMIGGTIVGSLNALLFYWLTKLFVRRYQARRAARKAQWVLKVAEIAKAAEEEVAQQHRDERA